MANWFSKIFGTYSDRELKKLYPVLDKILSFEDEMRQYSNDQLRGKTAEFRERLENGTELDELLPEAFAVVCEASDRVLGMRHFPVQLLGGIVLHQGRIAEMKTGEGKTLVATLPAYLNALPAKGVHIVTVNDYLARRDSEWMGKVYTFLGLKVGLVVHGISDSERHEAYEADITYATNNELGFDYLRDNMMIYKERVVQRGQNFAIVDEVDSILIDEARTPLIISGQGDKSTELYTVANRFVKGLKNKVIKESDDKTMEEDEAGIDYIVDEKAKTATLTAAGIKKAEKAFGITNLYDPDNMTLSHHLNQALHAYGIMHRDSNYVVKDGQVLIVDEFTGRIMHGRRYSDGLHQAIEAKEGVHVERESKTLATITFQNYFRLYKKLSGMTGTAQTEEAEFQDIYKLDVIAIPTNKPMERADFSDVIYKNEQGKLDAVVEDIISANKKGQPVLVGTITIEKSEALSKMLKRCGVKHEVLNAKFHEKEAEIIAQAGKFGAVTIATNMAGRGTDIVLGGNAEFLAKREMKKKGYDTLMINQATSHAYTDDEEILNTRKVFNELYDKHKSSIEEEANKVLEAGGLRIVGTERHESRRIDNQLRGRAGRQGDAGASRFYISLEDDLMRIFGSERMLATVNALGMKDDQPVDAKILSGAIETAQKRVEGRNFDMRKSVIQFDDVMNVQREIIYSQRKKVLNGEDLHGVITSYFESAANSIATRTMAGNEFTDNWDWILFNELSEQILGVRFKLSADEKRDMTAERLTEMLQDKAREVYEGKEKLFDAETLREVERVILLQVVDQKWMDHIDAMDQLRQGIRLRAYAQHDPIVEYKFEGMNMFEEMIENIKEDTVRYIAHAQPSGGKLARRSVAGETSEAFGGDGAEAAYGVQGGRGKGSAGVPMSTNRDDGGGKKEPVHVEKVGRNEMCPCGSGKKYKKCCGA
ncbi:MAG: preprotein translocase subunit SecA [Clostridiales bacterium]|jgi:preprotein translocase subunit SecA|nr:preprotein translocase subunit SecA [Clostridiales bacterium]